MGLERAFQLSTLLLTAIAFAGLSMTANLAVGFQLLGLGGLVLKLAELVRQPVPAASPTALSTQFWNIAILVAFGWFWVDFVWLSHDLLGAGVHFLIALMITKLFNLQQRRDYLQLYAISLMMVLASAGMTTDLWYGTVVVAYLLAGVWTLLLYQLHMEAQASATASSEQPGAESSAVQRIDASFFWTTNAFAVLALAITLVIFFTIPRIGAGFFQKGRADGLRMAGFSEQVDLGAIGSIKLDDSVVMRVEFPDSQGKPADPLYLRGMAYDWYNGRAWVNTSRRRRVPMDPASHLFRLPTAHTPEHGRAIVHDILLEPLDTPVLFGASMPHSLEGDFPGLQTDAMNGLYLPFAARGRTQYRVWSAATRWPEAPDHAAAPDYPPEVRRHYLQVPTLSPQIAQFAEDTTRGAATPKNKVRALFSVLQSQYRYSLDVGRSVSGQPLDDFLFRRKTGYCEHYATALVVLLRTVGVPARLVTGFLPSEWNEYGNYYTVRQRDAHAWVEVYDPAAGWITVDPTPSESAAPPRGWWNSWANLWDSVRLHWDRVIVQYSATDQMAVMQTLRDSTDSIRTRIADAWSALTGPLLVHLSDAVALIARSNTFGLLALLGLLLIGWGCYRATRTIRRWLTSRGETPASPDRLAAQQVYATMLKILGTKGFTKAPTTTPQEFVAAIGREWREAETILSGLTHLYYQVRFGAQQFTAAEFALAEDLLAQLRALPAPPADPTALA